MKKTIDTITDEQIDNLRREAEKAGDLILACVCRVAIGEEFAWAADETWGTDSIGLHDRLKAARFSSYEKARAECTRVIGDAWAQRRTHCQRQIDSE